MKRWMIAVCLTAACQPGDLQTSDVEQALGDCTPGGNYPGAKLPQLSYWNGKTPTAQPGQVHLDYVDPTNPGRHLAFLVDPGKGLHIWGTIVDNKSLGAYRASTIGGGYDIPRIADCCRPPPPPPGEGDEWRLAVARMNLEAGLRAQELAEEAVAAAGFPK
jgi:hypothetical protein